MPSLDRDFVMRSSAPANSTASLYRRGNIRLPHVYLIFFAWTLFSLYLYTRYSTLGDSQAYLTGAYDEEDGNRGLRTLVITQLAEAVFAMVRLELLAHLVFSAFAATGVAYMIAQSRLHAHYKWPLLAILITPNFGVWASAVGRESIFVGLLGLCLGAVLAYWRKPRIGQALLAMVCVAGMTFIRSPYGLALALFLLMMLIYRTGPRTGLSAGVQALLFTMLCFIALVIGWPYLDAYITGDVLPRAERYFTISSETTRTWINIDTTKGLLTSLWWSVPLALVGPTPFEVAARPLMFPFFASGVVVLGALLYSVGVTLRTPPGAVRKTLLLGWLPAVLIILVAYVPFGVYNPGSAIRYASCFLLFLVFPSLLHSAVTADASVPALPKSPRPDEAIEHHWLAGDGPRVAGPGAGGGP